MNIGSQTPSSPREGERTNRPMYEVPTVLNRENHPKSSGYRNLASR